MVTFATGSPCCDSAATSAWPLSWTATARCSSGSSALEASRCPSRMRSRASAKSTAWTVCRPARTAKIAASLTRLARSAPENPGVALATTSRSTSGPKRLAAAVHFEDGPPLALRGQRDHHLPVEPARAQQRRVQHLGPVGGRDHHHAGSRVEAVHLGEHLVERLVALVVGDDLPAAALADRVDLVDEDDAGRSPPGGGEQVADPGGADADEHLDEAGAGHRDERHAGLAGHRAPAASCRCPAARPSAPPWDLPHRPAGSDPAA